MTHQVHQLACCEAEQIGAGSSIGAFSHILPGCRMGECCEIQDQVVLQNNCLLGDNVKVGSGSKLAANTVLASGVSIGANVCIGAEGGAAVEIADSVSIENAVVIPAGIRVGAAAWIKAGTVVDRNIPPRAIVAGNPARIVAYVDTVQAGKASTEQQASNQYRQEATQVSGVTRHHLPFVDDIRGNLAVGEFQQHIPFEVKRFFVVFDVPSAETRGEHAHKACHQFLVCVKGSVSFVADDGKNREEFLLNKPYQGLHIPPNIWGIQYNYSDDAVLLVFASEHYDPDDYIRNYDEFLAQLE